MASIHIGYDIIGTEYVDVDLDDWTDEIQDEYGRPWDELTDEEKHNFVYNFMVPEYQDEAERQCDYSIGDCFSWQDEHYEDHYFNK